MWLDRARHLDTVVLMWTRLVAGAAAHDINNLAQGLFNLLALASAPTASREALDRYAALARDGIKELRQLGTDLRALAHVGGVSETQRLDLVVVDAVTAATASERAIDVAPPAAAAPVRGTGAALRLAIAAVVRYGAAASAPGAAVSVSVVVDGAWAFVVVTAPTAPTPRVAAEAELGVLLGGPEREFGGDGGLVLAGAAADLCGGRVLAGPAPGGGLRFKLAFPRADEVTVDAGTGGEGPRDDSAA
jgi:signal transduction histidine kinase